jgi:DNA-binding MarR family transcriptional regulator/GNAT superfamily N-acetyltransferase
MDQALVEQVRSFNRTVTERVGALNDHFLGRNHSLGEARLLWEIGRAGKVRGDEAGASARRGGHEGDGAVEVRALRARLALDSAYVSRLLRSLERQALVVVEPSPTDRRVRRVQLTPAGRAERAELDQRADAFAHAMLEPLSEGQQVRLAEAMAEVERLLLASSVTIAVADPRSADAQWCIEQYITELNRRFEAGWDPARSISAGPGELTPPAGLLFVAHLHGKPVGCGALKFHTDRPDPLDTWAELKRMWVAPQARGLGLGRRLLFELERRAREYGVTVLRLETNRALTEAIILYRASGYAEVDAFNDEPYAHHWFEKRLSTPAKA